MRHKCLINIPSGGSVGDPIKGASRCIMIRISRVIAREASEAAVERDENNKIKIINKAEKGRRGGGKE
jgi:hypothetical protein